MSLKGTYPLLTLIINYTGWNFWIKFASNFKLSATKLWNYTKINYYYWVFRKIFEIRLILVYVVSQNKPLNTVARKILTLWFSKIEDYNSNHKLFKN